MENFGEMEMPNLLQNVIKSDFKGAKSSIPGHSTMERKTEVAKQASESIARSMPCIVPCVVECLVETSYKMIANQRFFEVNFLLFRSLPADSPTRYGAVSFS